MPPKRSSLLRPNKPPRMTWGRAIPVLAIAVVFDLLRLFFEMFWFFGPAFAAVLCTTWANSALGTTVAGVAGKLVAVGCSTAAGAVGYLGIGPITAFGIVMAMTVGLFGWATVTLVLAITNPRIWKSDVWSWVWSIASLGVVEMPLLGAIPMLTITHWRLYAAQIRQDKAALKRYQKAQESVGAAARTLQRRKIAERTLASAAEPVTGEV